MDQFFVHPAGAGLPRIVGPAGGPSGPGPQFRPMPGSSPSDAIAASWKADSRDRRGGGDYGHTVHLGYNPDGIRRAEELTGGGGGSGSDVRGGLGSPRQQHSPRDDLESRWQPLPAAAFRGALQAALATSVATAANGSADDGVARLFPLEVATPGPLPQQLH
eukprot:SM000047S16866  [mRNA]  locus=s47:415147:415789:+ [translate_table: standard]